MSAGNPETIGRPHLQPYRTPMVASERLGAGIPAPGMTGVGR
jgi:hypothetical protein